MKGLTEGDEGERVTVCLGISQISGQFQSNRVRGAMTYNDEESVGQRRIKIIGSGDFTSPSLGNNIHIEHALQVEASQGMEVQNHSRKIRLLDVEYVHCECCYWKTRSEGGTGTLQYRMCDGTNMLR